MGCFLSQHLMGRICFLKPVITLEKDAGNMLWVDGGLFSPLHSNCIMVSVTSFI